MARHSSLLGILTLALSVAGAGCQLEKFFARDVGHGAARLTVRNAAILGKLIDDDTRCGFTSPQVLSGYVVDGDVGTVGTVTWTVSDCELSFGAPKRTSTDCNDVDRVVGGRMTVSAQRTVRGLITGDATTPVIPLENDAATLTFEADVFDYVVQLSNEKESATIQQGHISVEVAIHLARSLSMGVCAIDTSEVTLNRVTVTDAVYTVDTGDRVFDVDVPALEISAQLGEWEGTENVIAGSITVWDEEIDLGDDDVLDPGYDRDEFRAAYACKADLQVPQDYTCPDLVDVIGNGAARLLVSNVGNLVSAAVKDTRCGFASPHVVDTVRTTGEVGRDGGEAVFIIDQPCLIDLADDTFLSRTCQAVDTRGSGQARIRGTMRQRGRLTGDPAQPIIPTSRDAVEITFDVEFLEDGFHVATAAAGEAAKTFTVTAGGVTGRMRPRLAKDTITGACAVATPVVTFDGLVVKPGTRGLLQSGPLAVVVEIDAGTLDAQANAKDTTSGTVENDLEGSLTIRVLGEDARDVDVTGDLDPAYDPALATASYSCTANLEIPTSDDDCSFDRVLAENTARLAVQTAGTLAGLINADDSCGFEDTLGVLLFPIDVVGDSGDQGEITWEALDCPISRNDTFLQATDCSGGQTFVEGDATFVDVDRTVRGLREKALLGILVDSIVPQTENAVDIVMHEVQLTDFATWSVAAGADEPAGILVIHEGTLSATVQPATGARASEPETHDVATPVARLSSLRFSGDVSLHAQGKVFHFRVDNTELTATNGPFLGAENSLAGTVTIDGETHTLGTLALNPAYQASTFDAAYACTEDLQSPIR